MTGRRLNITDVSVAKLPLAVGREYVLYRDQKLKGFIVKAYKNRRVFKFESERRAGGKAPDLSASTWASIHIQRPTRRGPKAAEIVGRIAVASRLRSQKSAKGVTLGHAYAEHVDATTRPRLGAVGLRM